jgi:hypothetical protein
MGFSGTRIRAPFLSLYRNPSYSIPKIHLTRVPPYHFMGKFVNCHTASVYSTIFDIDHNHFIILNFINIVIKYICYGPYEDNSTNSLFFSDSNTFLKWVYLDYGRTWLKHAKRFSKNIFMVGLIRKI